MNKIFSEKYVAIISIFWAVLIAALLVLKRHTLIGLELNSIGDFLAGVFAPLGFFWLVAGFYQQGKGLEQNSEALKIQSKELEKSTEALELQVQEMKLALVQQTELTETTKQDLNLSKQAFDYQTRIQHAQAQPFFHIEFITVRNSSDRDHLDLTLEFIFTNSRATCREVEISIRDISDETRTSNFSINPDFDLVEGNSKKQYKIKPVLFQADVIPNKERKILLRVNFKYLDALDIPQESLIRFVILYESNTQYLQTLIERPRTQYITVN